MRRLGPERGGVFADGMHFRYQGGQVHPVLSLISYSWSGPHREHYLEVKIPPSGIQEHHLEAARKSRTGWPSRLVAASTGDAQDHGQ